VEKEELETVQSGFEQDKKDYWAIRNEIMPTYKGKWVAVHKHKVVAIGDDMLSILEKALSEDGYAYANKLGEEDKIIVQKRRIEFSYDQKYSPTPIPRVTAKFYNFTQSYSRICNDVIPDTGGDITYLPIDDCNEINLFLYPFYSGISRAFGGEVREATFYGGKVEVNGRLFNSIIEPVSEPERILGRDVLNQCWVTFDGPGRRTIFE